MQAGGTDHCFFAPDTGRKTDFGTGGCRIEKMLKGDIRMGEENIMHGGYLLS